MRLGVSAILRDAYASDNVIGGLDFGGTAGWAFDLFGRLAVAFPREP